MNFFAIPVFSFVPPKYKELVPEKGGKIFGALLVCFIIMGLVTGFRGVAVMKDVGESFRKECPDFELKNGELSIDNSYSLDQDDIYMMIDDSIESISAADVEALSSTGKYQTVLILGRNGTGMYSNGQIRTIKFSELGDFEISKDKLINTFIPAVNIGIVAACFIGSFFAIGIYYLVALLLQYLTGIFSKNFFKTELLESERFKTTVLAKFPPRMLVYVLGILGLHVGLWLNLILQLGFIVLVLYFYTKDTGDGYEVVDDQNSSYFG